MTLTPAQRLQGLAGNERNTEAWLARREIGKEIDATTKEKIGRDPRTMTPDELRALGHEPMTVLEAIRARCLDCCCFQPSEVRKCTSVDCPSWPFRMGWNPWRDRKTLSPEQRKALGDRLAASRKPRSSPGPSALSENHGGSKPQSAEPETPLGGCLPALERMDDGTVS